MRVKDILWYSMRYDCSIAQAIADRDYPANRTDCVRWFEAAAGRWPTEDEIRTMAPSSERIIAEEAARYDY